MTGTSLVGSLRAGVSRIRKYAGLNQVAVLELLRERNGGHAALPSHGPHLLAAVEWLVRAQDATPDGGFSRAYSLAWSPYFESRGWQPSYPETTGYLIPTMYQASRHLGRPDLAERAGRAARWEVEIQLPSGAVQGGVVGQEPTPAVFNTGQVIFGWLAAYRETGDPIFADAARRGGRFLVDMLDPDGLWRRGSSHYANPGTTLYNTRTAWALAEAGRELRIPAFIDAAARNLLAAFGRQQVNGWIPDCCLLDAERPLLHTIAYAIRGLLEGGRVLEDPRLIAGAAVAAEHLQGCVGADGFMPGRVAADWSAAASWSCLTGQAQIAGVWLRLFELTGDAQWLREVPAVLRFIKTTQNRTSNDLGLRGGIKGSFPIQGDYGRYELLNWGTKFFVDALMRHDRITVGTPLAADEPLALA